MITGIREKTIVGENGRIEISSSDLPAGAEVEVIVLVEDGEEPDTTEYLLSTEANREHLMKAIRDAENPDNLVRLDLENL